MLSLILLRISFISLSFFSYVSLESCAFRKPSQTCLFTRNLPINSSANCQESFCMPAIGNGFVGTFIMSDTINVAGVYNGRANVVPVHDQSVHDTVTSDFFYNHTHRARVPSTLAINFTLSLKGKRTYGLDLQKGIFYQWFDNDNIHIEQRIYAHRTHRNVLVNEIQIQTNIDFLLTLSINTGNKSVDVDFEDITNNTFCLIHDCKIMIGKTKEAEYENISRVNVVVVSTPVPKNITIMKAKRTQLLRFLTVIATSLENTVPISSATRWWLSSKADVMLLSRHIQGWTSLWNNGNMTVGNDNLYLSQVLYSSLYNILSSIRSDWIWGLSPGNLAGGEEYLGHVFWDQDIWMYPSLLMLFPDLAKIMQLYRYQRIQPAEEIAIKYGYKGIMFPWESAVSGFEVCPFEKYGKHEIHITGDIAFAAHQYYTATGDKEWLKKYGYEIITKAVKFWISRAGYRNGSYVIDDVMPPDEYQYPINNSFYTNTLAKLNVNHAIKYAKLLKKTVPKEWIDFEANLFLPYDDRLNYHPEFEGYTCGKVVKQADVILTNFPLMVSMDNTTIQNDLEYYDNITDPNGPAMTHSMFTIGWLQIGKNNKAQISFERNYEQINGPFHIWSEIRFGSGARNFITAAGGFLQSIIFGYGGLRLKSDGLYFDMHLPPNSTQLQLNGISYKGFRIRFYMIGKDCNVELLEVNQAKTVLYIENEQGSKILALGTVLKYCKGKIYEKNHENNSTITISRFTWLQVVLNFFFTKYFI